MSLSYREECVYFQLKRKREALSKFQLKKKCLGLNHFAFFNVHLTKSFTSQIGQTAEWVKLSSRSLTNPGGPQFESWSSGLCYGKKCELLFTFLFVYSSKYLFIYITFYVKTSRSK